MSVFIPVGPGEYVMRGEPGSAAPVWQPSNTEAELARVRDDLRRAHELLQRCDQGFGAFIMGRRLARRERDKLRDDIQRWLDGRA